MSYEQKHLDNAELGILPWWDDADEDEMKYMIRRLERGIHFCKGRAADLKPYMVKHVEFLKNVKFSRNKT